ncbi:MAG: hypothetical protein PHU85_03335 [Phycisphaerae bacterium]|nr:hypothetical protein [Phycisphaerae bacterium]
MFSRTPIARVILAVIGGAVLAGCAPSKPPKADLQSLMAAEQLKRYQKECVPDDWPWAKSHLPRWTVQNDNGLYVKVVTQDEITRANH